MTESWQHIVGRAIHRAKDVVERGYEGRHGPWVWLDASLDSYSSKRWRIRLLVLEGSPAKGYVVANYATGVVRAYDGVDKRIATYSANRMMNRLE